MILYDTVFLIGFLVLLSIIIFRIYNLFQQCKTYNKVVSFILLFISIISYFFILIITILDHTETLFTLTLYLSSGLFLLGFLLFGIEMLYGLAQIHEQYFKPYMANEIIERKN